MGEAVVAEPANVGEETHGQPWSRCRQLQQADPFGWRYTKAVNAFWQTDGMSLPSAPFCK